MSEFRFSYDVFSLVISLLVILYVIKIRSLSTFRNRVFLLYVLEVLTICIVDFVITFFGKFSPKYYFIIKFFECFYYSLVFFVPVTFLVYIFALVDYFQMVSEDHKAMLPFRVFFPICIGFFLIWASLFDEPTSPLFSYLSILEGVGGSTLGYVIEIAIGCYYIAFGVITMIQHKFRLEKNTVFLMSFAFFMLIVAFVVQGIFPHIRSVQVAFSFSLIIFSLFVQKPDFFSDSKSEVMNNNAFDIVISDYFVHKYNFKVVILFMEDTLFYKEILGRKEMFEFEVCMTRKLKSMFRDTILLKDDAHSMHFLLFKNAGESEMEAVITSINEQIKERWGFKGLKFDFAFRLCVVDGLTDVTSVNELRNLAYVFAHMDKYKGVCIKASELDRFQINICNQMELAINSGDLKKLFKVLYQPVFSVREKRITRAESLLCFGDNTEISFTTDSFLPIFEKAGHFFNINAFAFNSVCEMLSSIDIASLGVERIGINISIVDSTQQNLYEQIKKRLEFYKVSPSNICFEITQNATFGFPEIILGNIQKLSDSGIEMILDNFGLSNSNLNQFLNLSIGMIKYDARIVSTAWSNSKVGSALRTITKMAHDMGIYVIANGVESLEQRIWLEGVGCDYLQGPLFSKPVPEDAFIRLLQNQMA